MVILLYKKFEMSIKPVYVLDGWKRANPLRIHDMKYKTMVLFFHLLIYPFPGEGWDKYVKFYKQGIISGYYVQSFISE